MFFISAKSQTITDDKQVIPDIVVSSHYTVTPDVPASVLIRSLVWYGNDGRHTYVHCHVNDTKANSENHPRDIDIFLSESTGGLPKVKLPDRRQKN